MNDNEYIPTALRESNEPKEPRKEMWVIGIRWTKRKNKKTSDDLGYGISHGPYDTELEALEVIGDKKSRIIHFYTDGTYEIVWYWRKDRWIKRKNKKR